MAKVEIEFDTGRTSLDEIRGHIDATLDKHFPGDFLKFQWEGDILNFTGPGARGTMVFDEGRLRVQASLKPPASLMRTVIEHKIRSAFEDALGQLALESPGRGQPTSGSLPIER